MTRGAWVVVCPAYSLGPFRERETAERRMAEVVALGACHFEHQIEDAA